MTRRISLRSRLLDRPARRARPELARRLREAAHRVERLPQQSRAERQQRKRGDERQQDALDRQIEATERVERRELHPAAIGKRDLSDHTRLASRRFEPKLELAIGKLRLPRDDLLTHFIEPRSQPRQCFALRAPADTITIGRQPRRDRGTVVTRALPDQPARDDEMFGQPPRLVLADRKLAGAFVQQRARAEFDDDGQQQDREDPPDQPNRWPGEPLHRRITDVSRGR